MIIETTEKVKKNKFAYEQMKNMPRKISMF